MMNLRNLIFVIAAAEALELCGTGWRLDRAAADAFVRHFGITSADAFFHRAIAERVESIRVPKSKWRESAGVADYWFGPRGAILPNFMQRV